MADEGLRLRSFLDLAVVVVLVVSALVVVLELVSVSPAVRLAVGIPFLLFAPGYAVVTAIYPRTRPERERTDSGDLDGGDLDGDERGSDRNGRDTVGGDAVESVHPRALTAVERLGLSVVASLVVVGFAALTANFTPWGISSGPITIGVSVVTLVAAVIAVGARLHVRPDEQPWAKLGRGDVDKVVTTNEDGDGLIEAVRRDSTEATLLNLAVVVSVVVALALVAFQPFGSPVSDGFSEYQLLAEQDDGALAAANYPTEFTEGEADDPIFVQVQNHEGQAMEYTVVVQLQEVDRDESVLDGDGATSDGNPPAVTRTVELDRFDVSVDAGESRTVEHEPAPMTTGEVRLVYLFYEDDVPSRPTQDTADESLHLWIDVTDPDADE